MPFDLQPTLKGELLGLRPLRPEDFPVLFAVASDPLIWEQHPVRDRYTEEVFKGFFREAMESGGALIVTDARDGRVVGSSRFHGYDSEKSEIEIGWTFLARSHWGGTYNGEMKRLMLRHAFRFVNNVVFLVGTGNVRSRKAMEKIGGVLEGSRRNAAGLESVVYRISAHRQRGLTNARSAPVPGGYRAVVFDLLTALLDSWSLWNDVAGSEEAGVAWRTRYLVLTYEAGAYRSYEGIIRQSARDAGVPDRCADGLLRRWSELEPWPESREVLGALSKKVPIAVATNASLALANVAVSALGVPVPTVVTAEEAGYYKPDPHPYRLALERLSCAPESALFVAGSAADVPGASAVGMSVFWHNRRRLKPVAGIAQPRFVSDSLWRVLELV